jgi:hypothetical protein
MSGWDPSSRPTWDPQDGGGESTQAFSAPDFSAAADDRWPEPSASPLGSGYGERHQSAPDDLPPRRRPARHAAGAPTYEPGPAGAPPDSFQQDFGQQDFGQRDPGPRDRSGSGYGRDTYRQDGYDPRGPARQDHTGQNHARQEYAHEDHAPRDFAEQDVPRDYTPRDYAPLDFPPQDPPRDYAQQDRAPRDYVPRDFPPQSPPRAYAQQERVPRDYAEQESPRDFPPQDPPRDYAQQDYAPRDYAQRGAARDYASTDYAPRDRASTDRPSRDRADTDHGSRDQGSRDYAGRDADPDEVARTDPALQDFFAPQRPRRDGAQPGFAQPRHGARSPVGSGANGVRGGRPAQFGRPDEPAQASPRDTAPPNPGSRSGHRQAGHRPPRRSHTKATVAVGGVVVLGIAVGAFMLNHGNSGTPSAGGVTTPTTAAQSTAASAPSARASTAGQHAARTTGFILSTPATAGGYPRLTPVPADVQSAASATSQSVSGAVVNSGKVTSQVSAAYQLSGGQALAFTGYAGTFNPAKVIANLASFGADEHTQGAGPHGGSMICATTPGTSSGTVCVWATTTTVGITEFFSSVGPEVVTVQSKAAADTVKLRDSVEAPKP